MADQRWEAVGKDARFIILKSIKCTMTVIESVMCSALST